MNNKEQCMTKMKCITSLSEQDRIKLWDDLVEFYYSNENIQTSFPEIFDNAMTCFIFGFNTTQCFSILRILIVIDIDVLRLCNAIKQSMNN